ncbi:MAG: hypothetical protein JSV78_09100 [Phycisphaerales bacterium]|nr:MAG: hypothetical protein JSV78_09100 [Phycisphaerales bacterium]
MSRRFLSSMVLASCFMWAVSSQMPPAQAGQIQVTDSEDDPQAENDKDRPRDKTGREPDRLPRPKDTRELVDRLRSLHELMYQSIDLTREQAEPIDELFDKHFQEIRAGDKEEAEQSRDEARERMREIRTQLEQARDAGDKETFDALRKELKELRKAAKPPQFTSTDRFIQEIGALLDKEQRRAFKELVNKLGLRPPRSKGGIRSFRELMRVIRHPELGLTEEQQENIRSIVREQRASAREGEAEPGARKERLEKLMAEIMEQLTPQQQEKFKELAKQSVKRDKERRPGRRTIPGRDYSKNNGSQGEPEEPGAEDE